MKFQKSGWSLLIVSMALLAICCQFGDQTQILNVDRLYREYELQPTVDRAEVYLDTLDAFIRINISNKEIIKPYLTKGLNVSMAQGLLSRTSSYILPLLRLYPQDETRKTLLLSLGDVMYTLRKKHASSIIFKELAAKYATDPDVQKKVALIDSVALISDNYVDYLFDQILIEPDEYGVNRAASLKYVDGVEALALVSPENSSVPGHVYKAAEVARSMRTFPKAMSLYDWLIDEYPDHEKTPTAMFIKGFILEQDYDRSEEAKEIYTEFIRKYPDHEMAESAKFLLDNLGKSDEEILEQIEKNKQSN